MDNRNSVGYVVLGALLALITSLIVEVYKNFSQTRNSRKDFYVILKLELKNILNSIDNLIEEFGEKQFFPFVILNELFSKIQRLDKIRDKVIYIKDDSKKEEILSLFNEINTFHTEGQTLEQSAFPTPPAAGSASQGEPIPWNAEIFKNRRQMIAIKSVDLKRKIQDLILFLK